MGLADFAGPVALQIGRGHIAAVDDAERVDQFALKLVGAAAVIGQRCDRTHHRHLALVDAVIGFQAPDRDNDRAGNAVFGLDLLDGVGMLLEHLGAFDHAILADHAAGEFFEGLLEDFLVAVGGQHLVVDGEPVERCETRLLDALGGGFLLEVADEAGKTALVIALRGQGRRGRDDHGAGERGGESGVNFRH